MQQKCPLCRAVLLTPESSLVEPAVEEEIQEAPVEEKEQIGSKLEALLTILNSMFLPIISHHASFKLTPPRHPRRRPHR